jgi:hypothetical protein
MKVTAKEGMRTMTKTAAIQCERVFIARRGK